MDKRNLTDYYEQDVPAYASYDNLRKICGIDGLKLSQRKIIYAGFKRCYNDWLKTDTMCAQTQIDTNYIHGAANLEGVINSLVANYVGANNYPLLEGNSGGFGCRISPRPAAGRYTRIKLSNITKTIFKEVDNNILENQFFEGQYIEPKFLVPIIPVIFLNGTNGMSTGFSNTIYPRNPEEIINYIKIKLSGKLPKLDLLPWFKNHKGSVAYNAEIERNESYGVINKINTTKYTITELPIGIEYQKYCEFLDKLCENGTIQDYNDNCDPKKDTILFEIKTTREFSKKHENTRKLYDTFRLIKTLPETLCCIDENNRVEEFTSITQILDSFIDIRLKYYDKRKEYLMNKLSNELKRLVSKMVFFKGIIDKTIVISNKTKDNIEKQLEKIDKIIKFNDSYDYLLNSPLHSITKEKIIQLKEQILKLKEEFDIIKNKSSKDMWIDDLNDLKKVLK